MKNVEEKFEDFKVKTAADDVRVQELIDYLNKNFNDVNADLEAVLMIFEKRKLKKEESDEII